MSFKSAEQGGAEVFVPLTLLLLGEMDLPKLLGAAVVAEDLIAELLAGQVEDAVSHHVEAVVVPVGAADAADDPAVDVLGEEGGYGALPQGLVVRRPPFAHTRGAGVGAPELRQSVVEGAGVAYGGELGVGGKDIGILPAVEAVIFHRIVSLSSLLWGLCQIGTFLPRFARGCSKERRTALCRACGQGKYVFTLTALYHLSPAKASEKGRKASDLLLNICTLTQI